MILEKYFLEVSGFIPGKILSGGDQEIMLGNYFLEVSGLSGNV